MEWYHLRFNTEVGLGRVSLAESQCGKCLILRLDTFWDDPGWGVIHHRLFFKVKKFRLAGHVFARYRYTASQLTQINRERFQLWTAGRMVADSSVFS